jgi:hypothetical protein
MNDPADRLVAYGPAAQDVNLPARQNPPGLDAVSYRGATYPNALARMLARVSAEPALSNLNVEATNDWSVALMHAWSVVTDVLSFYHERILNEGFLRTATERRSLVELGRTVGYDLRPGAAASTHLAFRVQVGQGEPPRQAEVPAGTAVLGMSASSPLPQVFETSQPLTARSDWNSLRLANGDAQAIIWPDTASIRLAGSRLGLRPGDALLIVDEAPDSPAPGWVLAEVSEVQADLDRDLTLLSWKETACSPDPRQPVRNARLYKIGSPTGLLSYTRTAVNEASPDLSAWWPAGIGLPRAEVHALVTGSDGKLFAGTDQDVFCSADGGASWKPVPTGPMLRKVTALAMAPEGSLFAGTNEGGIYQTQDGGLNWTACSGEAVLPPSKSFQKWFPFLFSAPLPKTTVRALVACPQGTRTLLVAGTDQGAYRSLAQGKTWQPASFDLPGLDWKTGQVKKPVWALAVARQGRSSRVFAATDGGVFQLKGAPRFWPLVGLSLALSLVLQFWKNTQVLDAWVLRQTGLAAQLLNIPQWFPAFGGLTVLLNFALGFLASAVVLGVLFFAVKSIDRLFNGLSFRCLGQPVFALAVGAGGQLFAGTARGVYGTVEPRPQTGGWLARLAAAWQAKLSRGWRLVTKSDAISDIRALAVSPEGDLYAGTARGTLFHYQASSRDWADAGPGWSLAGLDTLLATGGKVFAGGVPPASKIEQRWARAQMEQRQVDLAQVTDPGPLPAWVVVRGKEDPRQARVVRALQAAITSSPDINQAARFTRLGIEDSAGLGEFDRETATVWTSTEALPLYDVQPVQGDTLLLEGAAAGLGPERLLVLRGRRARVRFVSPEHDLALNPGSGQPPIPIAGGEALLLMCPPVPVDPPGAGGTVRWRLQNRFGLAGTLDAPAGAFTPLPAADEDETVAEVVQVEYLEARGQAVCAHLGAPLQNVYDRLSLVIYGNVIPATHGQTVRDEVLGSGDGSQANQRFRLRQSPLTYTHAPTVSGVVTALHVLVNGVEWHAVPSLQWSARDSRNYMVRQDARGNTNVLFGDGVHGARLPSGFEQVTATYRIGLGESGNLPAGQLNQMQSALPYIEGVNNPVAAEGGLDPEDLVWARQNTPYTARTPGRIVSLSDYEDFVGRFAGIGKVQARWLRGGPRGLIQITVAGSEGQEVPEGSELYRTLLQAIDDSRDTTQPPVHLDSYEPVYFHLSARLLIDPDHRARLRQINEDARARIVQNYAFEAGEFGREVTAARLVSLLQALPGVVAVQLMALHRSGEQPALNSVLRVRPDGWSEGQPLPAQMLVVDAVKGIDLELEVTQ